MFKQWFKKVKSFALSLFTNFLFFGIGLSFYATDMYGEVILDETANVPFLMFLVGCYLFPWYALNKEKFSPKLRRAIKLLFAGSFLFTWALLLFTEGYFSPFLEFVSFFGSIIAPVGMYHVFKNKWGFVDGEREQEKNPEREQVKKENPQNPYSLHEISDLVKKIKDEDVKEKAKSIHTLLTNVVDNLEKLDVEEKHIMKRLIKHDLKNLLSAYLHLSSVKKEETESEILENLDIIERFLHSLLDGVSKEHMKEMKVSMKLIEERYQK